MSRRHRRAVLALAASALLALPALAPAKLHPGDIVVADSAADPARLGTDTGAIFKVDASSGAISVLAASSVFDDPRRVAIDAQGRVVVADSGARGGQGAIFRFAPGDLPGTLATSSLFVDPFSAAVDAEGRVVVPDFSADPFRIGAGGAIFRFAPGDPPRTLATSSLFGDPKDVAIDARGRMVVADDDADPSGIGGARGAIFRFAPGDPPRTLATSSLFVDPISVAIDAQGRVVVADANADPSGIGGARGAIFRFAPGDPPRTLATSSLFRDPFDAAIDAQGRVLVADPAADPLGIGGAPGAIFRFAPGDPPSVLATSAGLLQPQGVAVVPPRCFGEFATSAARRPADEDGVAGKTIVGDDTDNTLVGTDGDDVIVAGAGDDRIVAAGGNDLVCGGKGNDVLKGGKGRDRLAGGRGKDRLVGGTQRDVLLGGAGKDLLKGKQGRDKLRGGAGADTLLGGKGRDNLKGGKGRDKMKQ